MPFEKGNTLAKNKGKHEKTKQWEALGEAIVTTHAGRFNSILSECDDEQFAKHFTAILEYFKPKQARTEVTGEIDSKVTITFTDAS